MQRPNNRRQQERPQRDQEFDQKVLDIARVARVIAGGRRFSFRATVVIGDRKSRVGVGVAKGSDVSAAINKAVRSAKKDLITVPMTPQGTLPYDTVGKESATYVYLKPAKQGRGIIAGGAVRTVCDLAGYKDIAAKVLSRSTNKLNMALAAVNALKRIDYTPMEFRKKKTVPVADQEKTPETAEKATVDGGVPNKAVTSAKKEKVKSEKRTKIKEKKEAKK